MVDFAKRSVTSALTDKEVLLAIPFFVISGAIMTGGVIARRLIKLAKALVNGCPAVWRSQRSAPASFAAIGGSSPVTVIAIGSMMYPPGEGELWAVRQRAGDLGRASGS